MGLVSDTVLIMGKSKATVLGKGSEEPIRASVFSRIFSASFGCCGVRSAGDQVAACYRQVLEPQLPDDLESTNLFVMLTEAASLPH